MAKEDDQKVDAAQEISKSLVEGGTLANRTHSRVVETRKVNTRAGHPFRRSLEEQGIKGVARRVKR
jgi:hypothetical protein